VNNSLLSEREIDMLLNLSLSADTNWGILIGSSSEELIDLVRNLFIDDPQVSIKSFGNTCDLLVALVRDVPDLVIIDDNLPVSSVKEVVRCIKRTEFLKDIKIFYNLTSSFASENGLDVDAYITQENLDRIYISRKLNSLLYTSTAHRDKRVVTKLERKWPRINLELDARIEVIDIVNSTRLDSGTAVIKNLSISGACISQIQLKKGCLPAGVFSVRLQVNRPPLKDWRADTQVARANGNDCAGLKFVSISKENKNKIMEFFEEN
jgi:hypothetical protein